MNHPSSSLKRQSNWTNLYFYQKSDVLYQLTVVFCERFLPRYGDRTLDQMVQAARSGKQNIVEGLADGITSTELQLKLLNVARASLQELHEDYRDYLHSHNQEQWGSAHPRFKPMQDYCKSNNNVAQYKHYFERWTDVEMANCAITLCHMTDVLIMRYIQKLDSAFVQEGGIKERMHAARTGYRQGQDERLKFLEKENSQLKNEIERLKTLLAQHGIVH